DANAKKREAPVSLSLLHHFCCLPPWIGRATVSHQEHPGPKDLYGVGSILILALAKHLKPLDNRGTHWSVTVSRQVRRLPIINGFEIGMDSHRTEGNNSDLHALHR